MTWDLTNPPDTDPIRQGAGVIRVLKSDVQTAAQVEHIFPGANPANPVLRWKPRRDTVGNRPAPDAANPGSVYVATDLGEIQVDTGTSWQAIGSTIFPGMLNPTALAAAPPGWLLCNGAAVSRATYANLFAAIGISHGQGDGSTTFNVPDYRGLFLRMVDGSAGRDPDTGARTAMAPGGNSGNNVGSVQDDATAVNGLSAQVTDPSHHHGGGANPNVVQQTASGGSGTQQPAYVNTDPATTGITVGLTGNNETRPTNAYVNYVIKI